MDKKHQKCPKKMAVFPHLRPPKIFIKNRALSLLYNYGALTSCKKLEKNNERTLRYLKTETHTDTQTQTHRHKRLLRTPSGKPGVQNTLAYSSLNNLAIQSYKAPLTTLKYKNLLNHYRLPYKRYF